MALPAPMCAKSFLNMTSLWMVRTTFLPVIWSTMPAFWKVNRCLAVGLFVQAEIEGPEVDNVVIVPRYAMRNDSQILIVDAEDRLYRRQVDVLRIDRDRVLVAGPLAAGERICVSPLQVVVEGMKVRPVEDQIDAGLEAKRS